MRIFVAIDLPQEIREALASLVNGLRDRLRGVRWVRPQGVHLTLRFIGEVDEERVEMLRSALREAIPGSSPPFGLHVRGLGVFPESGRPRVLWVAVEQAAGRLSAIQREVELAAMSAGFPEETRPFRPHLTVGRFGGGGRLQESESLLEEFRDARHGSFTVSSVTIFQSLLNPGGAEYRRLEEYPLDGPRDEP